MKLSLIWRGDHCHLPEFGSTSRLPAPNALTGCPWFGSHIDWEQHTVAYRRRKTSVPALISSGDETAATLQQLPKAGSLFPALAGIHERHRAKLLIKRLVSVGIPGVSLHSYRFG